MALLAAGTGRGVASADYMFTVRNANFDLGGSLSGFITTSNDLRTVTALDLTVTPGTPNTAGSSFTQFEYTLSTARASISFSSAVGTSISITSTGNVRELDLATSLALPTTGTTFFSASEYFTANLSQTRNVPLGNSTGSAMLAVTPSAAVPEPSSLALCGIAGAFCLGVARFRRRVA